MNTVHLNYFAILREQAGRDTESVESAAATLAELYRDLARRHGFTLPVEDIRVAVGTGYAGWDQPVTDGMTITFIPPVAGG
jgi:sulfur-carrier protein